MISARFQPLGHPVEIRTNSEAVIAAARASWDAWPSLFCTAPIPFEIEVHDGPAPAVHPQFEGPPGRFRIWSDDDNSAAFDFASRAGRVRVSADLVAQPRFRHHFLVPLILTSLDSVFFTPLHAACVAREGEAALLCGDSGAGKSTLAYACARRGWTFICDDVVHLTPGRQRRGVGGSQIIHLREPSRAFFPELSAFQTGIAPNGKRAIEIDAAAHGFRTARQAIAARTLFLRRRPGPAAIRPFEISGAVKILLNALVPRDTTAIEPRLRDFLASPPLLLEYEGVEDAVSLLDSVVGASLGASQ
jgi:hypothetical protein